MSRVKVELTEREAHVAALALRTAAASMRLLFDASVHDTCGDETCDRLDCAIDGWRIERALEGANRAELLVELADRLELAI